MAQGIVKWLNGEKGFGFIAPEDGSPDIFVHSSQVLGDGLKSLREGQCVEFEVSEGRQGAQANSVRAVVAEI